jgi:hypothetical protein
VLLEDWSALLASRYFCFGSTSVVVLDGHPLMRSIVHYLTARSLLVGRIIHLQCLCPVLDPRWVKAVGKLRGYTCVFPLFIYSSHRTYRSTLFFCMQGRLEVPSQGSIYSPHDSHSIIGSTDFDAQTTYHSPLPTSGRGPNDHLAF